MSLVLSEFWFKNVKQKTFTSDMVPPHVIQCDAQSAGISVQRSCITSAPGFSLPAGWEWKYPLCLPLKALWGSDERNENQRLQWHRLVPSQRIHTNARHNSGTVIHALLGSSAGQAMWGPCSTAEVGFPKHTSDCCVLCPLKPYGGSLSSKKDLVVRFFSLSSGSDGPEPGRANLAPVCTSLGHPQSICRCCSPRAQFKAWLCLWVTEPETCTQVLVLGNILEVWQRGNDSTTWRLLLEAQFCHQ